MPPGLGKFHQDFFVFRFSQIGDVSSVYVHKCSMAIQSTQNSYVPVLFVLTFTVDEGV